MSSLWGGRFTTSLDDAFNRFNQSLRFDSRMFSQDLAASQAFALGLQKIRVLTDVEHSAIKNALIEIEQDVEKNPKLMQDAIDAGVEDIHSFIEQSLANKIGDLAFKANTGRSRNEQVSTSTRLWLREAIDSVIDLIKRLQQTLCQQAEKNLDTVLIGYTHLQRAQPIVWGHYFLSFFEMLQRDVERFEQARSRMNICPLGCGALAGNSWGIDRELMAKHLGFDGVSKNSLDSTSDRDFIIDFLSATSTLSMHLSRLAEDLIIYATTEFNMVEMSDSVTTGSSLMPQKKNPDAMELIRGKTGRVYGHLTSILTMTKGLPSCYNKDMQEDKEALFDAVDTITDCLVVSKAVVDTISIKQVRQADRGYITATELADYLAKKQIPFRKAHHMVGEIVVYAIAKNKKLTELTIQEFQKFSPMIQDDVYEILSIESAINVKNVIGGTAVDSVKMALKECYAKL
ncbi:MAG: argininosuccinate lyase [Francisellaceae bacterium]|jgi:argininosuccinate lyase